MGGSNPCHLDVEVISMLRNSMTQINSPIPSLAKELSNLKGIQLSNCDLIISGGYDRTELSLQKRF